MSTAIAKKKTRHGIKRMPAPKNGVGYGFKSRVQPNAAGTIQHLREGYGVSQRVIVRLTGYSPRSIVSWEKGKKATRPAEIKLTELRRLFDALADITQSPVEVKEWLETPNEAFEGSTPLQVIERGESDRIWRMIYFLRSGEPA